MSVPDVESNYPRETDKFFDPVNTGALQRIALSNEIFTGANFILGFTLLTNARESIGLTTALLVMVYLGIGVGIATTVGIWTTKAHSTVCFLRSIHPRYAPFLLGVY